MFCLQVTFPHEALRPLLLVALCNYVVPDGGIISVLGVSGKLRQQHSLNTVLFRLV